MPTPDRSIARPRGGGSGLRALVAALALAMPATAVAQQAPATARNIDIEMFQPGPGRYDLPGLYSSRVQDHLQLHGGLYYNYSRRPLTAQGEGYTLRLVSDRHTIDVLASIGLFDRAEIGLVLPFTARQYSDTYDANFQLTGDLERVTAIQDIRLVPKVRIYEIGNLGLAAVAPIYLPTGRQDNFLGQGFGAAPMAVADYSGERWKAGLNAGFRFRGRQQFLGLAVGNEFIWGLGGEYRLPVTGDDKPLSAFANLQGRVGLSSAEGTELDAGQAPLEAVVGAQLGLFDGVQLTGGAGFGLGPGYGTPDFRVFVGAAYNYGFGGPAKETVATPAAPVCPNGPEDLDGFEDDDNCADPDNDGDGVRDALDLCPNEPETVNSYRDDDGCPDEPPAPASASLPALAAPTDSDSDGVVDAFDRCPRSAEDPDNFQDEDGCPDDDNDRDGVRDGDDKCPLEGEVINGKDDEDGCPDAGEPTVRIEAGQIVPAEKLGFAGQSDKVAPKSVTALQQVALLLKARPELKLVVQVHTDEPASPEANQKLSQARADNVKAALVTAGVDAARIEAKGLGNTQPADTAGTPKAKETNRRVELLVSEGASR